MTAFEDIPFSDIAEDIALKYGLSSVLIVAVERSEKGTRMSWGYEGSVYECSGAARKFCRTAEECDPSDDDGPECLG